MNQEYASTIVPPRGATPVCGILIIISIPYTGPKRAISSPFSVMRRPSLSTS